MPDLNIHKEGTEVADNYALELKQITKRFGSVLANDHVDLTLKKSEDPCDPGGERQRQDYADEYDLRNLLSGFRHIFVDGKEVTIRSPRDSFELGIGMVHQHFKLVDVLTAAENIILGLPGKQMLNMKKVTEEIQALLDRYGFDLDLSEKIYQMSVRRNRRWRSSRCFTGERRS